MRGQQGLVIDSPWMRMEAAAQYCGFTIGQFRLLRHELRGPAYHHLDRTIWFHRDDLDDWMQSRGEYVPAGAAPSSPEPDEMAEARDAR